MSKTKEHKHARESAATSFADEIDKAEKLGIGDVLLAMLLAVVTFALQWLWEYPGIHPALWDQAAVATGVRPPVNIIPGFAIAISSIVYKLAGVEVGTFILRSAGHGILAIAAMFVFMLFREILTFVMRSRPQISPRRTLVMRIAALVGTFAFVSADPVWAAGQFFGETTLLLALTLAALEFFFAFLRKGTLKYSYMCAITLGLLMAETPAGIVLTILLIAMNFLVMKIFPNLESPFFKPALIEVGKWHMTFLLIASFCIGVAANCVSFKLHGGLVPLGESVGDLPLKYLLNYSARVTSAASGGGWILLLSVALGPLIISLVHFAAAADEEKFLAYPTGIVFLCCGALSLSQCASLPALWFWTYFEVSSSYLLALATMMSALMVSLSVTILGVDSLCRDHRRIAVRIYGNEDGGVDEMVMSPGLTERLRKFGIVVVPMALIAALLPGRVKSATRAMLALVRDVVEATVDEVDGAKFLFSDGNLDAAIEVEALARSQELYCVSLMGLDPNAVWLRARGLTDAEDLLSFRFDGAMGLRSWIRDKPASLTNAAVQVGFDLWKRDGKALPPIGGLVSRPAGGNEEARTNAVERARALAHRAMDIYDRGIGSAVEKSVKRVFFDTEWRLARMCLYRAEFEDLSGDADAAMQDMELSRRLNERNDTFKVLMKANERRNEQMMRRLTPREGLQLALARADFTLGKIYAEAILDADLENPDANFALAMYYFNEQQLSRSEEFFKRCLIRNPEEPAVYNNLAIVQLRQGKLEAASLNVARALEIIPTSAEVLDTQKQIEEAKRIKEQANAPDSANERLRTSSSSHNILAP